MKLSNIKIMKAAILIFILLMVILAGLCLGVQFISPKIVLESLMADDGLYHTLIYNIRIPRIAVALLVGSWLSVGGVAFQSIIKTPWPILICWAFHRARHWALQLQFHLNSLMVL
jgi:iron complex transport system permease protein